jgi:hypothetical protein
MTDMGTTVFPERQAQKIVSDLADSLGSTLTKAGARAILTLKLNGLTPERPQELAGKANEGLLTAEEFGDYATYAQLRGLLAALQSKARLYLKQSSLPASGAHL